MATQVSSGLIENNAINDSHIANVALTGVTASSGDSSTSLATTAFVAGEINSLIDAAPGALNTLNELAAAMGDDANFSTTITNSIATKLPLAGGTMTGLLTAAAKIKLTDTGNATVAALQITDSGVGISSPTTDQMNFITADNTRMIIDSSGNLLIGDGTNTERSIRIQNSQATGYFGVEGSSANRFVGSTANNMFLGTTTADGIEFATNNTVKATINSSGNLGLGTGLSESRRGLGIKGSSPGINFHDADVSNLNHEIIGGGNAGLEISADYNNVATSYIRFDIGGVEKMRIFGPDGQVGINKSSGLATGGFGTPMMVIKQKANSQWGGILIEAHGNDGIFAFGTKDDVHVIEGSYRSSAGYKPIEIRAANKGSQLVMQTDGNVRFADNSGRIDYNGQWRGGFRTKANNSFVGQKPFNIYAVGERWHELHGGSTDYVLSANASYTTEHNTVYYHPSSVNDQRIKYDFAPRGGIDLVYQATPSTSSTWNGGFNSSAFTVDPDKCYMFGYYFRRIGSGTSGTHYFGFSHGVAAGTGSTVDSNPYFFASGWAAYARYQWHVAVCYLFPRYYTGGTSDEGSYMRTMGVWNLNGDYRHGVTRWKQPTNQTTQTMRAYNYYSADPNNITQYASPFVYECNGSQPTLGELLIGNERIGE